MRSVVTLEYDHETALPDGLDGRDVRMSPGLVRGPLWPYTDCGDRVLDSFAGFDTMLAVAEEPGSRDAGRRVRRRPRGPRP